MVLEKEAWLVAAAKVAEEARRAEQSPAEPRRLPGLEARRRVARAQAKANFS